MMQLLFVCSAVFLVCGPIQHVQGNGAVTLFPRTALGINRDCCPRATCHARNDPHMKTFDGSYYEIQNTLNGPGEYVLYKHTVFDHQVNVYFGVYPSRRKVLNVCGVVVRAGCTIFRYIFNEDKRCEDLLPPDVYPGPEVIGENDGQLLVENYGSSVVYFVHFPTGTRVEIRPGLVKIWASSEDLNNVEGLCGTFTNKCEDDFLKSDGTYDPFPTARICTPNLFTRDHFPDFSESWRITHEAYSLFYLRDPIAAFNCCASDCIANIFYCACDLIGEDFHPDTYHYRKRYRFSGTLYEAITHQRLCMICELDQTDELFTGIASPMDVPLSALTVRSVRQADQEEAPAIPESAALGLCRHFVKDENRLIAVCLELNGMSQAAIDAVYLECLEDIELSGTNDFTGGKFGDVVRECVANMINNRSPPGPPPPPPGPPPPPPMPGAPAPPSEVDIFEDELNNMANQASCPNACSGNGECDQGVCVCTSGSGDDCSEGPAA